MPGKTPSLIKWSGSKRTQAALLHSLIPPHDRYFEPFLGGGALLYLDISPEAFASDIYKPLIDIWLLAKHEPELLVSDYTQRWLTLQEELIYLRSKDGKSYLHANKGKVPSSYYDARKEFNKHGSPYALNFILRTCVNGIVRFNAHGEFNNSFHLSRDGMAPARFESVVSQWNRRLKSVRIDCSDYRNTLDYARPGDFVYLDPPYLGCVNRYCQPVEATQYFNYIESLNSKGVLWMSSFDGYSDDKDYKSFAFPESLYRSHRYIRNGRSFTSGVLNAKEGSVHESIYANFLF
jgi:DNA adenine methylase